MCIAMHDGVVLPPLCGTPELLLAELTGLQRRCIMVVDLRDGSVHRSRDAARQEAAAQAKEPTMPPTSSRPRLCAPQLPPRQQKRSVVAQHELLRQPQRGVKVSLSLLVRRWWLCSPEIRPSRLFNSCCEPRGPGLPNSGCVSGLAWV